MFVTCNKHDIPALNTFFCIEDDLALTSFKYGQLDKTCTRGGDIYYLNELFSYKEGLEVITKFREIAHNRFKCYVS